ALVERQASLLQPGITGVDGSFDAMSVVRIVHDGVEFARGQCSRDAATIHAALGSAERDQVVVHRDLLALLQEAS
ncbi:MAG: PUA domain-containing protein, partial [Myxococcota bacterium]